MHIGIISASGVIEKYRIDEGLNYLNNAGYQTSVSEQSYIEKGRFPGNAKIRAKAIEDAFCDPEIDVVMASRGGYGCALAMAEIDFNKIAANPKPFIGYSDLTVFINYLNQEHNIPTIHGPMIIDFSKYDFNAQADLAECLANKSKALVGKSIVKGNSTANLIGGNLSVLITAIGTKFDINTNDKILLLEDVGEELYSVDRMLTQLDQSGKLANLKGLILGNFSGLGENQTEAEQELAELLLERFSKYGFPIVTGVSVGHIANNRYFRIGAEVELNATTNEAIIKFKE